MSFSRSLSRAITKASVEAINKRKREQQRIVRERQRAINQAERVRKKAADKAAKERYKERRKQEAEQKTKELLASYQRYFDQIQTVVNNKKVFSFDQLTEVYIPQEFCFAQLHPQKDNYQLQSVPKESWLEKVFIRKKQKRLSIIVANRALVKRTEEKYNNEVEEYNQRKDEAYRSWEIEEAKRKAGIRKKNERYKQWKDDYNSGYSAAIKRLIQMVLDTYIKSLEAVRLSHTEYISENNTALIRIDTNDRDAMFRFGRYRYMIRDDEFRPIQMTESAINKYTRTLFKDLMCAVVDVVFKNDIADGISRIAINGYHMGTCCVTCEVSKTRYKQLCLSSDRMDVIRDIVKPKVYKQIYTGLKPIKR